VTGPELKPRSAFEAIVADLDYPMFIVTTSARGEPLGCLVGFATQASIDPPRFLVCLSHTNRTYRAGGDAAEFAVHCVPAEAAALAELFGGETGDRVDKFARCRWHAGPAGLPILDDCPNWLAGRVVGRLDAGDHDVIVLEPFAAERHATGADFTFHRARRIDPGHAA
jgi:flavin reductase (DIM6/NTAB) family NADH-FMN oxidoreductase RutF